MEKTSCDTANSETAITSETTTPETTTSEIRLKPLQPTPGSSTQSQSGNSKGQFEKTSDQVQIAEIYKQFPDAPPSNSIITCCACKSIVLTSQTKSITELKSKETGKSSITVGLETNQYLSVNKLQCSGLCILKGKGFIAFCVKSIRQQMLRTKRLSSQWNPL